MYLTRQSRPQASPSKMGEAGPGNEVANKRKLKTRKICNHNNNNNSNNNNSVI